MPKGSSSYSQGNIVVEDVSEMEDVPVESSMASTETMEETEDHESSSVAERAQLGENNTLAVSENRLQSDHTETTELSSADIQICQRLDREYERALEEREIGYSARFQSVRQSAFASSFFFILFLVVGTSFLTQQAGLELHDALFFSIFTMTTVGYGLNETIHADSTFQIFVICYIFTGIATLTIMVAQVYQYIALQASQIQHSRDRTGRRKNTKRKVEGNNSEKKKDGIMKVFEIDKNDEEEAQNKVPVSCMEQGFALDFALRKYEELKVFFRTSQIGRSLSVVFPLAGLILLGAVVVGPIENWSVIDSIYFACVSLTTVGYGSFVPHNPISIYFCIFWLPFSIGFMSLFLANIATFYIRLSDRNINRIERKIRRRLRRLKEQRERNRKDRPTWCSNPDIDEGKESESQKIDESMKSTSMASKMEYKEDAVLHPNKKKASTTDPEMGGMFKSMSEKDYSGFQLFGTQSAEVGETRRAQIIENSSYRESSSSANGQTMQTMKDVLRTVHRNLDRKSDFLSIHSDQTLTSSLQNGSQSRSQRKPTFALRVLVQERFAKIIAVDIAGFQSQISIKNTTMSVTINRMQETADKWSIPKRARKAFRAAAFEVLFFVGEHSLVTRGADALFDDLSPFEFHGLFASLLAAMGDAESMEQWLEITDILADVDLSAERKVLAKTKSIT